MSLLALLCWTECLFYHTTTLDILKLCSYKCSTFTRLYMLELYDLKDVAVLFERDAVAEITSRNHKDRSSNNTLLQIRMCI